MNLYSINTGLFKLDGGAMFGVVPKTIWSKTNPADENNLCTLAMRCLLVEEGNRLILIDTGIGDKQSEKFFRYYYLHGEDTLEKSLKQHGFHRDDITDVFLTHLHLDHVGGAVVRDGQDLVPAFKNAVYWTSKRHWDWAANPNEREKASFLAENINPLQESGKLNFINESNPTSLTPDFGIRFTYGHTDSMMLPTLQYKDRTVVFVADLLPTTGHIPVPYVAGYDVFPLQSMAEKRAFLDEAQQNNYILFFEHDAVHECCTLQQTEKGIRLADTFSLRGIAGR
ncbi:glyoxylase-like metal-dependent hydrolase (beta-lactamase superfamily II) [Arcticibacter tournemirensis]|uniref:MBL fold metallo-hydrolase n=1 Tax=Arcticibacter tournemirensis TaxID=699437 RepID=A0A5M9HIE1_9SPHI|nr:MBL fold metallo-hydrolase [Arcticibacter tournemirensis]KAA8486225.1 MBL fold metallo-hydrolase [Arcticibacter tournemirensis]TQM52025.1 glyoxylase-like metal-dependent hydrolase (beta-lactamase superfamily II) [Arcticibacter tournemirensis]